MVYHDVSVTVTCRLPTSVPRLVIACKSSIPCGNQQVSVSFENSKMPKVTSRYAFGNHFVSLPQGYRLSRIRALEVSLQTTTDKMVTKSLPYGFFCIFLFSNLSNTSWLQKGMFIYTLIYRFTAVGNLQVTVTLTMWYTIWWTYTNLQVTDSREYGRSLKLYGCRH